MKTIKTLFVVAAVMFTPYAASASSTHTVADVATQQFGGE